MIQCENLSREELCTIGQEIADAFLAENGCFTVLSREAAGRMFTSIVEICYRTGHLYTTGPGREGFCAYWTKKERPGIREQLRFGLHLVTSMSLRQSMALANSQTNWLPTEKRYKKREDFVEVFLLAVRKEYQGQGYFRKMLEEPFQLAKQRGTICVLDTDSQWKADKYCHVGMHIVDQKTQKSGITMFALEK